jgi:hypothetical protein
MKNIKNFVSFLLSLTVVVLFAQFTANAGNLKVQNFTGNLDDNSKIEIFYIEETQKLGVVIKDLENNPISGYILKDIKSPKGTFNLSEAKKFGSDNSITTIKIDSIKKDSVAVKVKTSDNESFEKHSLSVTNTTASAGSCDNYCNPPNPANFNWYLCFWCCATTTRGC